MRFGTYSLPISLDPDLDSAGIDQTLQGVVLAEKFGFDAAWLTEHHFNGTAAYADPVIFAAAVAMRTVRVKIGFAVVQMAIHHPVRLAVQTAIVDNLSKGRLIVGTGRGSGFSHYEYTGFGTEMQLGRDMLPEAEELLVKAWTGEDVRHRGKYWTATFPRLRPRPFQRPHPPLLRACASEESTKEMAKQGRPVLFAALTPETVRSRLTVFKDTMAAAEFDESAVESAGDQIWLQKDLFVSDSQEEAEEVAAASSARQWDHIRAVRAQFNPDSAPSGGQPDEVSTSYAVRGHAKEAPSKELLDFAYIFGTPKRVAEQVAELREAGVRNLMFKVNTGQMPFEQVSRSMRLFQEQVAPQFRP